MGTLLPVKSGFQACFYSNECLSAAGISAAEHQQQAAAFLAQYQAYMGMAAQQAPPQMQQHMQQQSQSQPQLHPQPQHAQSQHPPPYQPQLQQPASQQPPPQQQQQQLLPQQQAAAVADQQQAAAPAQQPGRRQRGRDALQPPSRGEKVQQNLKALGTLKVLPCAKLA